MQTVFGWLLIAAPVLSFFGYSTALRARSVGWCQAVLELAAALVVMAALVAAVLSGVHLLWSV